MKRYAASIIDNLEVAINGLCMSNYGPIISGIGVGLAMFFAPRLAKALTRMASQIAPAGPAAFQDFEALKQKYGHMDEMAMGAFLIGMMAGFIFWLACAAFGVGAMWPLLGLMFGWGSTAPILYIAMQTLPKGLEAWNEYWNYLEFKREINLKLIILSNIFFIIVGIVSTIGMFL